MPVPRAQLRRIQCQVQTLLTFFEGQFGTLVFGVVQKSAEKIGAVIQHDLLCAERAIVNPAIAGVQLHLKGNGFGFALDHVVNLLTLCRNSPQPDFHAGTAQNIFDWPAQQAFEMSIGLTDKAVFQPGQKDYIGTEVIQSLKAFFRLAGVGDLVKRRE